MRMGIWCLTSDEKTTIEWTHSLINRVFGTIFCLSYFFSYKIPVNAGFSDIRINLILVYPYT